MKRKLSKSQVNTCISIYQERGRKAEEYEKGVEEKVRRP